MEVKLQAATKIFIVPFRTKLDGFLQLVPAQDLFVVWNETCFAIPVFTISHFEAFLDHQRYFIAFEIAPKYKTQVS